MGSPAALPGPPPPRRGAGPGASARPGPARLGRLRAPPPPRGRHVRLPGGGASLRGWAGAAPAPLLAARGRGGPARPCPGAASPPPPRPPHPPRPRRRPVPERSGGWGSAAVGGDDAAEGAAAARGLGGGAGLRREGVLHRPRQPHHQLGRPPRQVGGGGGGAGGRGGQGGGRRSGSLFSPSPGGGRTRGRPVCLPPPGAAPRRVLSSLPSCPVGTCCRPGEPRCGSAGGQGGEGSGRSLRYPRPRQGAGRLPAAREARDGGRSAAVLSSRCDPPPLPSPDILRIRVARCPQGVGVGQAAPALPPDPRRGWGARLLPPTSSGGSVEPGGLAAQGRGGAGGSSPASRPASAGSAAASASVASTEVADFGVCFRLPRSASRFPAGSSRSCLLRGALSLGCSL